MPKSVFLNVLQRPSNDNEPLILNFVDNDDPTGFSNFSITICNLLHTDTEDQCARKTFFAIQNGLSLNNAVYNGTPVFNNDTFPFTFRPLLTQHTISLWSQSNYLI